MSAFAFPCPACGERCRAPDRFCAGCGASLRHVVPGGLPEPSPVVQFGYLARPPWWKRRIVRRAAFAVLAVVAVVVVAGAFG